MTWERCRRNIMILTNLKNIYLTFLCNSNVRSGRGPSRLCSDWLESSCCSRQFSYVLKSQWISENSPFGCHELCLYVYRIFSSLVFRSQTPEDPAVPEVHPVLPGSKYFHVNFHKIFSLPGSASPDHHWPGSSRPPLNTQLQGRHSGDLSLVEIHSDTLLWLVPDLLSHEDKV